MTPSRTLALVPSAEATPPVRSLRPPENSFFGRERELRLLFASERRLVTLVGAPGIGKTRPALEAARRRAKTAQVGVLDAAASVNEVSVSRSRQAEIEGVELLVLDHADPDPEAVASLIDALLQARARLCVWVTSRQRLGLADEMVVDLGPLEASSPAGSAVALLIDRANAARGDLEVDDANLEALTAVAQALDGIPLGLEIAALALRSATPASRLGRELGPLDLDEVMSERVLRHAVESSYQRLGERLARAFEDLFRSSFDLSAAASVMSACDRKADAMGVVAALRDRSLLEPVDSIGAAQRFRVLTPVRQFAGERLRLDRRRERDAFRRHAEWCLASLQGAASVRALREHEPDLRIILERARRGRLGRSAGACARRAVVALETLAFRQGPLDGHVTSCEAALSAANRGQDGDRARILTSSGWARLLAGEYAASLADLRAAEALAAAAGDTSARCLALLKQVCALGWAGDFSAADGGFAAVAVELENVGPNDTLLAMFHKDRGVVRGLAGQAEHSKHDLVRALEIAERRADLREVAIVLAHLGARASEQALLADARAYYERALREAQALSSAPLDELDSVLNRCFRPGQPRVACRLPDRRATQTDGAMVNGDLVNTVIGKPGCNGTFRSAITAWPERPPAREAFPVSNMLPAAPCHAVLSRAPACRPSVRKPRTSLRKRWPWPGGVRMRLRFPKPRVGRSNRLGGAERDRGFVRDWALRSSFAMALMRQVVAMVALLAVLPGIARAEEGVTAEARRHYDRALQFVDEQAWEQAAAQFERAYEFSPHPLVLYNMGEAWAGAGRPVEALEAYERYLATAEDDTDAERLRYVEQQIRRQLDRVGELELRVEPQGAAVRIDGRLAGRSPLPRPVRVMVGRHTVSAALDGYRSSEREVTVGSGETLPVKLVLEPVPRPRGRVSVRCPVPEVVLSVDGSPGRLAAGSLDLVAGRHTLVFKRAGYVTVRRTVLVEPHGEVLIECAVAPRSPLPDAVSGMLAIHVSEPEARVRVDGAEIPSSGRLPSGAHDVEVTLEGFRRWSRRVRVDAGTTTALDVELVPTAEQRREYVAGAEQRRTWGILAGATGVALLAGAATIYVWNTGRHDDWAGVQSSLDRRWPAAPAGDPALRERQAENDDLLESIRTWDQIALGSAIAGALFAGTGVWLHLGAPDPGRYDRVSRAALGYRAAF